jgi:nitrate reductase delta subunit
MTATVGTRSLKRSLDHQEALAQVCEWTRLRFKLEEDATILVAEIACGLPGCPPLETAVAFWTSGAARHQFKVFKPVRDVTMDDLPFTWLKDSLVVPEGFGCDCC